MTPRLARFFPVLLGAGLVAAVILAYQPVWHGGWLWEDDIYITQNRLLTSPDGLFRTWFSQDAPSQYFPLVYTVFRLEHALWGFNPAGFHWTNILVHAASGLLLWQILKRLSVPGAWLGALLFALHPVQVESVAWVSELKNVLSLFCSLLSVLAWIGFVQEHARRRWLYYVLALLAFSMALFSKTTACTLPAALLLILWLKKEPLTRARWAQVLPFFGLALGMGMLTMWWERHHIGTGGEAFGFGPLERVLIASRAVWFYAAKLIWPADLCFSYSRWVINPADPLAYLWLFAGALACVFVYLARSRLGRGPEVALAFFVATLAPLLGFVMLFTFWYSFVADHYQYVACIGPLALLAAFLAAGFCRRKPLLGQLLGAVLVLVLGTLTWQRAHAFQNLEALWRDTVSKNPGSLLAHRNLGRTLMTQGRLDEAAEQFRQALRADPTDVNSLLGLGNVMVAGGKDDAAIECYRQALQINPDSPEAHVNLAVILANHGKVDEAIEHNRKAIALNPTHLTARVNLAVALAGQGHYEEALEQYRIALRHNPDHVLTHVNMAIALTAMGRTAEAREHYQLASAKLGEMGLVLAQQQQWEEAKARYREALRFDPQNAQIHCRLAAVLQHQGNYSAAREQYAEALRLNPGNAEAERGLGELGRTQ
jgi:tetratricopeptide (TPR) repeat protein